MSVFSWSRLCRVWVLQFGGDYPERSARFVLCFGDCPMNLEDTFLYTLLGSLSWVTLVSGTGTFCGLRLFCLLFYRLLLLLSETVMQLEEMSIEAFFKR
jgi:hypothetical protein